MKNSIFQNIQKEDFQLLLNSLEDVFYESKSVFLKEEIVNLVKQYITIYHKGDIDLFIADISIGDNAFVSPSFISSIKNAIKF